MSEWLKGFVFAALLPLGQAMAWQAPVRVSPNVSVVPLSDENASVVAEANVTVPTKPVRSSTQETINQAGRDLRHVEENVRSGAARLLGKYPSPASAAYLTFALGRQDCSREESRHRVLGRTLSERFLHL